MKLEVRKWVLVGLAMLGGLSVSAQSFGSMSSTSATWGNSGYVNDYYYGEQSAFQTDDNMFNYGNSFVQDMGSTSSDMFAVSSRMRTAASSLVAGSTLMGYEESQVRASRGGGIAPPTVAPIGDGWDVLLFLMLLAIGYGVYVYKQKNQVVK
ncbi:MAG: hypothetical protein MJZ48_00925 [Paludibacteraceae bacterium]|nr:hypothetical protein [Paludibacteraceae bacterium]